MAKRTGGDIVVRALADEGIPFAFGIPGTHNIELDDSLAEAYGTLGNVRFVHDWDLQAAESAFRRSIELDPNYALALAHLAWASEERLTRAWGDYGIDDDFVIMARTDAHAVEGQQAALDRAAAYVSVSQRFFINRSSSI